MNNKTKDWGLLIAITFLAIGLLFLFFPYNVLNGLHIGKYTLVVNKYSDLGTFVSGMTAPFLSISAFILLYLTYKSQRQELADSRTILQKQADTLEKQQFETTFFNLLNLHHSIVNAIDVKIVTTTTDRIAGTSYDKVDIKKSRDCFLTFYSGLHTAYGKVERKKWNSTTNVYDLLPLTELDVVKKAYSNFFDKHKYDLGHYFRNLYHIVKFVHNSQAINKQEYISILRAQLSTHELLLLFYNGVSEFGTKFKPLIESYHLLKNLPKADLIIKEHLNEYNASAYGNVNSLI